MSASGPGAKTPKGDAGADVAGGCLDLAGSIGCDLVGCSALALLGASIGLIVAGIWIGNNKRRRP